MSAGISIEALADAASVGLAWLAKCELGKQNPTVDTIDRLALALGVDPAVLYADLPPGTQPPPPLKAGRKPRSR